MIVWKITYKDESSDEFYDISLEEVCEKVNKDKTIVMIERFEW